MPQTTSPAVRLRRDAWDAWMSRLRIATLEERARYVGIGRSHLYRILNDVTGPGEQFIAGCMAKYDGSFEELFEIARPT